MKRFALCLILILSVPKVLAEEGSQATGSGGSGGGEMGKEQIKAEVMKILNDSSSCAGEEAQKMEGKSITKASEICGSDTISKEQWQGIIMAMVEVESSGKCSATGDSGGKSQGLLQSTTGDKAPNPKSAEECSGDQKDCLRGLKCGMCLALSNVAAGNVLFVDGMDESGNISDGKGVTDRGGTDEKDGSGGHGGGGGSSGVGLAKMFGPWRSGNPAHQKQIDLAKKECSGAKGSAGGGTSTTAN